MTGKHDAGRVDPVSISGDTVAARIRRIKAMPDSEARAAAERLLDDPEVFNVRRSKAGSDVDLSILAPNLRQFFEEFDRVEARFGDLRLDRGTLRPSVVDSRYVTLGAHIETEVAAIPGKEPI